MSRYRTLLVLLATAAIIASCVTEAKKRPGGRRRRPSRLSSLFGGRSPRTRNRHHDHHDESKRVYYYSLPPTTGKPPRIILGDELDFSSMGINTPRKQKNLYTSPSSHSPSSLSALEHEYGYDDIDRPVPHPPLPFANNDDPYPPKRPRKLKKKPRGGRGRGPGYRLENGRWQDHYVLEHEYQPQKSRNQLAVMPYLKNAGRNLVGAYRAAVINSAKVAHFTGHAASKYFKGVRNLMGSKSDDRSDTKSEQKDATLQTSPSNDNMLVLKEEQPPTSLSPSEDAQEVVEIDLTNMNQNRDGPSGQLPKVYLDWGGSFWRFFYNKRNEIPTEKKISQ